jgi:phosphate/sulfate permease
LLTSTYFSGFATELGAAFTVLLASKVGIPVSTTYCAIGAVVGVGFVRNRGAGVQWKTFASIVVGWIVTVPLSAAAAAVAAYILVHFVLGSV